MSDPVKEDSIQPLVPGQDPVVRPITIGGKEAPKFGQYSTEPAPVSEITPVAESPKPQISPEVSQYVGESPGAVEDLRLTTDQQQAGISNSPAYTPHPLEPSEAFSSISSLSASQVRSQINDAKSESLVGKLQVALRQILRPKPKPEPAF